LNSNANLWADKPWPWAEEWLKWLLQGLHASRQKGKKEKMEFIVTAKVAMTIGMSSGSSSIHMAGA